MVLNREDVIRKNRKLLENPYAHLDGEGGYDAILVKDGAYIEFPNGNKRTISNLPLIKLDQIKSIQGRDTGYSKKVIAEIARKLQRKMWLVRSELFPEREKVSPLDILDPIVALKCIGYSVHIRESLGQNSGNGEMFEVAGIINTSNAQVQISRRFPPEIRNFTMAHELGHAILHEGSGLHRDRALDGSSNNHSRNAREVEADGFAAYFLLPRKQIKLAFQNMFLTQCFILNEYTAFALTSGSLDSLQKTCKTLRDLTRILASAERYNGVQRRSLASQFNVSTEAMAIRLEELDLIQA